MSSYLHRVSGPWTLKAVRRSKFDGQKHEKKHDLQRDQTPRPNAKTFLQQKPLSAVVFTVVTILAIVLLRSYLAVPVDLHGASTRPGQRYMQLVIPINRKSDVDLCKTILSAQVLNYPVPVVVPWGNNTDNTPVAKKKRMYHKVAKIYSYLSTLPPQAEDAIIVLLDGPDTWFQLRPDLLLQGYYRVIDRANKQLLTTYGDEIQQRVVFSAYDDCGSKDANNTACLAAPEPPHQGAPKFLGHGAMVGQAKDLREILRRALDKLELSHNAPAKLLPIYTDIFGEQESHRKQFLETHKHSDMALELGIGLDYYNELGFSVSAETIPNWQTPRKHVQELQASMPPYWTVSGQEPGLPHTTSWSDIKLFTGFNNTVPAMIHHWPTVALGGKDATGHRGEWWPELWLTEHARALYTASERLPSTTVAQVRDDQGQELIFWNRQPHHNRMGAWTPDSKFSSWQDMCSAERQWMEVFRDELGPWHRTEFF
ncbi:hypothetical protein DOTSEDRAFT_83448 [Dothistroma septosporum NZE10]|uniref:Uncharacterized protein n=1 Tax=Dothistroma septosporum (strain NZE10 / CBS 128990) TaxID=675120 RepID=M2YIG8_DOTSN|nr:hypothetical protein DOTSEDRAFT_83448 [Dothistroma septosporum NZE10]